MRRSVAAVGLVFLVGCVAVVPRSKLAVTEAGAGISAAPRPADCRIEFYRTKAPDRAYDELATIHFSASSWGETAVDAQEAMRAKACELGADAVVVTLDYIGGAMKGTAVSYRDLREGHRVEHALRQAEKRVEFEKGAQALGRPPNLPPGYVPARARRDALLRLMAGGDANGEVPGGQFIWVEPEATRGYRRAVAADGSTGYVDEDALEFAPPEPKAPPAPPESPSTPERTHI